MNCTDAWFGAAHEGGHWPNAVLTRPPWRDRVSFVPRPISVTFSLHRTLKRRWAIYPCWTEICWLPLRRTQGRTSIFTGKWPMF